MFKNLRRKVAIALGVATIGTIAGAALDAAPASATEPVISTNVECSDGHTLMTVTIEPVPGHTVSAWNTWGAIMTQGTALPTELGKLGLGSHELHVQIFADTGGFTKDYALVVNPLGDCETPTSEETVATTVVDTVPVTNATTEATASPTAPIEPTVAPTAPTTAAAAVDTTTTSTTAVGVLDDSDTQAAVEDGSQLPRTGGSIATYVPPWSPFPMWLNTLLLIAVGVFLVLTARRRRIQTLPVHPNRR